MSFDKVAPENIRTLHPYVRGLSSGDIAKRFNIPYDEIIELASNENPYGQSPDVAKVFENYDSRTVSLYPDGSELIQAIADFHGVKHGMVTVGNGSNDILSLISQSFLKAGTNAVTSEYAFSVYGLLTQISGATSSLARSSDYGYNLDEIVKKISSNTRVIWIDNPNNPTGTFLSKGKIEYLLSKVPSEVIVVLDEAYAEYLPKDKRYNSIEWLNDYKNLVVVRTFSKAYGLAGLRVGYAVGDEKIIEVLNKVKQPFNVNTIAARAAIVAIRDREFVKTSHLNNLDGLQFLREEFLNMKLFCLPAYGNFITVRFDNAQHVFSQLLRHGIVVRPLDPYGLGDFLRITIGTSSQNLKLVKELRRIICN